MSFARDPSLATVTDAVSSLVPVLFKLIPVKVNNLVESTGMAVVLVSVPEKVFAPLIVKFTLAAFIAIAEDPIFFTATFID